MSDSYRLVIEQGAQKVLPIRWYTDATKTTMKDLSTYTARMQARVNHADVATVLSITDAQEIVLSDGTGTENILITLPTLLTTGLPDNFRGVYDLELVDSTGEVTRLIEGALIVTPEVTR